MLIHPTKNKNKKREREREREISSEKLFALGGGSGNA